MNLKLEVSNFELKNVKFNSKKGLVIDFYDLQKTNEIWNVDSDGQPHEDYHKALSKLKEVFAYVVGLGNGWDFAREHNRKNDEALKKSIQFWKDEIEKFEITGLTLVGKDDNQGIKIKASLQTDLGKMDVSSPNIMFNAEFVNSIDETIMIGDLAEEAFLAIQLEVWRFIFKNKRGGELFPAEAEEETPKGGLNVKMQKVG